MAFGNIDRLSTTQAAALERDAGLRKFMLSVYNYMASGLALSGIMAILAHTSALREMLYVIEGGQMVGRTGLGTLVMWAPLVMLFGMMFARNIGATGAQIFYWAFVAVNGLGLSMWLEVYTGASLTRVFFITAAAFAGLSLYGYTTKKNLTGMRSFLTMAVIGLLIAMIVNMFVASSMLMLVISAAGVLIFSALVAYDTQNLKLMYVHGLSEAHGDAQKVAAIFGALGLYINFINLMQFLLMFLGNRE